MIEPGCLAGLRVLVVEDEMLVSLLVEELLMDLACVIVGPFDRVPPALEAAMSEKIDLAVLDVNVAGIKIYPVAEALDKRRIPFVLVSGYGRHAVPTEHPEWVVCSKPFRGDELISLLMQQLVHP